MLLLCHASAHRASAHRAWACPCPCREGEFVREIASLPLAEDIPVAFDSCRKGPRGIEWRDDKPAEVGG